MGNLNLSNIRVAIFDFDDTLAVHENKDFSKHCKEIEDNFLDYYSRAYLNSDGFYENIEPCTKSNLLYEFINILRDKGVKIYCLSGMNFSFHLKAKQNFVNKYYGNDIEFISVKDQETKVEAVKIISYINNCNLEEILFVDDREENIKLLKNIGVYSLLPKEVEMLLN